MSYDLAVFEPEVAPKDPQQFLEWYSAQTDWSDSKSYDDPASTSHRLQAWLAEMFSSYPPMNGPHAPTNPPEDESSLTEYSVGENMVYVGFAWSKAEEAFQDVVRLADKHRLGFFNVSSDESEVWLPTDGQLVLSFRATSGA